MTTKHYIYCALTQIEALRDLKVKQEELSKNERMTRKKMVSNIRALQVHTWTVRIIHYHLHFVKGS